ncbi:MAG: macro domain-containing protein [Candidatus Eisenbacteria bacterium]|nr:macro domain-containing protein [Candidatus Eisenbacteria bacterium]
MSLGDRLVLVQADITTLDVDAIVNAANIALMPGGGVCGAIHRAAGPELAEACQDAGPCPTGDARATPGFGLKARVVIHAVGPVWKGGSHDEDRLLATCYRAALSLADSSRLATVAFPAISTGIYGFPLERATRIALREIASALGWAAHLKQVTCACFDAGTLEVYQRVRVELGL